MKRGLGRMVSLNNVDEERYSLGVREKLLADIA